MSLGALVQAVLATLAAPAEDARLQDLTPREKAALVVVSGLPAPEGVAGVIVRPWDRDALRPEGALVFVDQEGGLVKAFPELPPWQAAAEHASPRDAFASGRATGRALRRAGVHVDFAPVLDASDGPLGSRHFPTPELGLAFARGLRAGGADACAKHFPGLGSASVSTDFAPRVHAAIRRDEMAAFRTAVRGGVSCVMVSHALYREFGGARAVVSPRAYRLLRRLGFDGVAITDSLSIVRGPWPVSWARRAVLAGADLVLFTSAVDAERAIRALVPLAREGLLDEHVVRVIRFRRSLGLPGVPAGAGGS